MRLIAPANVGFAPLRGRLNHPAHSVTLIAKLTLALEPGGTCKVVRDDENGLPIGDVPYAEDELGTGVPRYESDYAYFKPHADVMVVGHFHAPRAEPVRIGEVSVTVGNRSVRAAVVGRRRWYGSGPLPSASHAEPFTKLELRWSHAFGGEGNGLNPVGQGYVVTQGAFARDFSHEPLELPRIERFEKQITHVDQANEPICFAPRSRVWPVRRNLIGTCGDRWLKTRWPWFPEDCDMRYFQGAIPELQFRDYLRGDERLHFKNMHPQLAELETHLPGARIVAAVQRVPEGQAEGRTEAVAMKLDTLWVDMDTQRAHLVWRGQCVSRDSDASDIAYAWVGLSTVHEELTPEQTAERARAGIAADEAQWVALEVPAAPPAPAPPPPSHEPEDDDDRPAAELQAVLAKLPTAPQGDAPALSPEQQARMDGIVKEALAKLDAELTAQEEEDSGAQPELWTRERVRTLREQGESLEGLDLTGIDLSGEDLSGVGLAGTVLKNARLDGASFRAATLSGASLEGASLNGVDLSDALLDDALLSNSKGADMRLDGAQLQGADLSGCSWQKASLRRTNLQLVQAAGATFDGSTLDEATLSEANFERGSFVDASFTGVTATGTRFNGATVGPATFKECQLAEADFSAAKLDSVTFVRCVLDDVMFENTQAPGLALSISSVARLRASQANFAGAEITRIDGKDCVLEGVILTGANINECKLPGADFSEGKLDYARFGGCDLKHSKFVKSNLMNASLIGCDLFESSFEAAQMERCDGSQSSFFRSEFLDAQIAQFHGKQRDLTGTKLASEQS